MKRLLSTLLISASLSFVSAMASAQSASSPSVDGPTLAESTAWLTATLPSDTYTADFVNGEAKQHVVNNSFDGCVWTIQRGVWQSSINKEPGYTDSIQGGVWMLRFEPRASLKFKSREMAAAEASDFRQIAVEKFKQSRPQNTWDTWISFLHGSFTGHVDTIDMSLVRLDSFTILPNLTKSISLDLEHTDRDYVFLAIEDLDERRTQRFAAAFRHIAALCGATNDPF